MKASAPSFVEPDVMNPSSRRFALLGALALFSAAAACVYDDGSGVDSTTGGDPWLDPPMTINDGQGVGILQVPNFGSLQSIAIGFPDAQIQTTRPAGAISLFTNDPGASPPVVPHSAQYSDIVAEGSSNAFCSAFDTNQRFAFDDPSTSLGFSTSMAFMTHDMDVSVMDFDTALAAGSPSSPPPSQHPDSDTTPDTGRISFFHQPLGCWGCAVMPTAPQEGCPYNCDYFGNEFGTQFGATIAFGVFQDVDVSGVSFWRQSAFEKVLVGAPLWNANGGVHVYSWETVRAWYQGAGTSMLGDFECDVGNTTWPREQTLVGGLPSEEFGRSMVVADFTCDGYDDVAVGAPGADLPVGDGTFIEDAGAVYLFRGGPLGLGASGSIALTQGMFGTPGTPEAGDRFGEVLAVGNFNGKRVVASPAWSCWDLAVGTPNEDDGLGEVQVFYGDSTNLGAVGPIFKIGQGGVPGVAGRGDRFGSSLLGFRITNDDFHDLVIGAPGVRGGKVWLS